MTWRYCVTREEVGGEIMYAIRELYTDTDGSLSWTDATMSPYGETLAEFVNDLALMADASTHPILDLTVDPPALVIVAVPRSSVIEADA